MSEEQVKADENILKIRYVIDEKDLQKKIDDAVAKKATDILVTIKLLFEDSEHRVKQEIMDLLVNLYGRRESAA